MKAQRVLAYLIDAIIISIVSSLLCFLTGLQVQALWTSGMGIEVFYNPVMLCWLGVSILYFLSDGLRGGSPGKSIMKLMVTVEKPGFMTALVRALVKVLSIHVLIGIILFLTGDGVSSLHDKVAGTRVQKRVAVA